MIMLEVIAHLVESFGWMGRTAFSLWQAEDGRVQGRTSHHSVQTVVHPNPLDAISDLIYADITFSVSKIPHKRDTKSLDVCGQQYQYQKNKKVKQNILSHVTCHMSPMPTATARNPPPANFPSIYLENQKLKIYNLFAFFVCAYVLYSMSSFGDLFEKNYFVVVS